MAKPTCRYILDPAQIGKDAVYCGKPVKYKIVLDDDRNKMMRQYSAFCEEHDKIVEERSDHEDLS